MNFLDINIISFGEGIAKIFINISLFSIKSFALVFNINFNFSSISSSSIFLSLSFLFVFKQLINISFLKSGKDLIISVFNSLLNNSENLFETFWLNQNGFNVKDSKRIFVF